RRLTVASPLAGCLALLLTLVAGCSTSGSSPQQPPPSSSGSSGSPLPVHGKAGRTLHRFYGQRLSWHDCSGGFLCASMSVPVDYSHPRGATLQVAVIKRPSIGSHQ